jgi:hypothetical protein
MKQIKYKNESERQRTSVNNIFLSFASFFSLTKKKSSGQAETPFILSFMLFLAFLMYLTISISSTYPGFKTITSFDFGIMGGSIIGVAAACAVVTGLACAGALAIFGALTILTVQNTLLSALIIVPILVTVAYVVSRLSRGGG